MNVHPPIPVNELASLIKPHHNKLCAITFVFKSGRCHNVQFNDPKKRDEVWNQAKARLQILDFILHLNMLVRAEDLAMVETCRVPNVGNYLCFKFLNGIEFKQFYADKVAIKQEHKRLTNILSFFQDRRTNCPLAHTKH